MTPTEMLEKDIEVTSADYELVRKLAYDRAGINLGDNRHHLVQARLAKRIRVGHFSGFRDYFRFLENDATGDEISNLIDAISTNTTFFFREPDHFDFLKQSIRTRIQEQRWDKINYSIRIWSSACSSGEEPYTIAMVVQKLLQEFPAVDFKILATDISQKILRQAQTGRYDQQKIKSIPEEYRREYINREDPQSSQYSISEQIRKHITFSYFNLMDAEYPFKFGFDYVFCRNVMIYFDRPTQENVVNKIARYLRPNGFLVVGHSESLNGLNHELSYIKPTIYKKR
jgi:chemotaxis protein methyltransferase CheR